MLAVLWAFRKSHQATALGLMVVFLCCRSRPLTTSTVMTRLGRGIHWSNLQQIGNLKRGNTMGFGSRWTHYERRRIWKTFGLREMRRGRFGRESPFLAC